MSHAAGLAATVVMLASLLGGELTPPGAPAPTMHSLEEIYDAVTGGPATLVYPQVFESAGSVTNTQYSFDTVFHLFYTDGYKPSQLQAGKAAEEQKGVNQVQVSVYVIDNNGNPAVSSTDTQVANPAVFTLSAVNRHVSVRLQDLFTEAGGFPLPVFIGTVVLAIEGGDWNDVAVQGFILHAHTGPFDLDITALTPQRVFG